MDIKDVILESEKLAVIDFLAKFNIKYEGNIDHTLYIEQDGVIIGTISSSNYIIKCLAVDEDFREENLSGRLVSQMINYLRSNGIYYYQVFTKQKYQAVFESFGFSPILNTQNICILEGGNGNINSALDKLKVQIKYNLDIDDLSNLDIGCAVINGNPFTNGHLNLIDHIAKNHSYVLVFVLEEEGSYFTFKERFTMAYLALKKYSNVAVLPSTKYIVSMSTFPSYFLKTFDDYTFEYASYDALIFKNYFMPQLGISKRYVGTETVDYMCAYNKILKDILGDKLEIIPRFADNNEVISAKSVREYLKEGNLQKALNYIPTSNSMFFTQMVLNKNDNK